MNTRTSATVGRWRRSSPARASALPAGRIQAATKWGSRTSPTPPQGLEQTTGHRWGWANRRVVLIAEHTGQALVEELTRAKQALGAQDSALAASNLAYARELAQAIELEMPYVQFNDRLETANGKLGASAARDFFDDLAPAYAGIDDLMLVAPELGEQVKDKARKTQKLAKAGKPGEVLAQVDGLPDHVLAARVYIPIAYVQGQIDAARKTLARCDIEGAYKGVEKALGSLTAVITDDTAEGTVDIVSPKH